MTNEDLLSTEIVGGVATITLQRPSAANALDRKLKESLLASLRVVASDTEVRAVLLAGSGKAFCVGQDLAEHAQALEADPHRALDTVRDHYNPIIDLLSSMPKPVVVQINGACVGAGLGIALAGDMRVASDAAKFGTAFTGIGLASDSGLSASLVHALGASRATELFMLGEICSAGKALEWGLVHRVLPPEEVESEARALAQRLAAGPTSAYAELKALLRPRESLRSALNAEAEAQRRLGKTADHHNAVGAFLAKQQPEFSGH